MLEATSFHRLDSGFKLLPVLRAIHAQAGEVPGSSGLRANPTQSEGPVSPAIKTGP